MDEQNDRMIPPHPGQQSPAVSDDAALVSPPTSKIGKVGFALALVPAAVLLLYFILQPG